MADEMIDSESDERTRNNAVRHQYRTLDETEKQHMLLIKDIGQTFLEACDKIGHNPREVALARTNLEQAVMWAVKAITA